MKQRRMLLKPIQNSRGFLTAEFLFALVLCAGLCIVLFSLNFTLSMAEVAQYIAFSTARAHAAAQVDQDKQVEVARAKYKELIEDIKFSTSPANGAWFVVSKPDEVEIKGGGVRKDSFSDYPEVEDRIPQVGVRFNFSPRILNIKIAFLGSTSEDPDAGFSTKITGFLIREPTHSECWQQMQSPRYDAILNLDPRLGKLGSSGKNKYVPLEDNGC